MRRKDDLRFEIHSTREAMGEAAARRAARTLVDAVEAQGWARAIFACAPSQNEFIAALRSADLPWERIEIFHMDEYIGLASDHPASFRRYLREGLGAEIMERATVRFLRGEADDAEKECLRYERLLTQSAIDLCCLGIGENGHIAFNDPPVADFEDAAAVKIVELDAPCREQQVHDGCFPTFDDVPRYALTLTIPALISARCINCVVPGSAKAEAVRATLEGPISTACPASILRTLPHCLLYLNEDSAASLALS
jgi:glucosamine-6-phosphate deaminase